LVNISIGGHGKEVALGVFGGAVKRDCKLEKLFVVSRLDVRHYSKLNKNYFMITVTP